MSLTIEWDVDGEYVETQTELSADNEIGYTESVGQWKFIHKTVLDRDLVLGDVNIALLKGFRIKIIYFVNTLDDYTQGATMDIAIVPQ